MENTREKIRNLDKEILALQDERKQLVQALKNMETSNGSVYKMKFYKKKKTKTSQDEHYYFIYNILNVQDSWAQAEAYVISHYEGNQYTKADIYKLSKGDYMVYLPDIEEITKEEYKEALQKAKEYINVFQEEIFIY